MTDTVYSFFENIVAKHKDENAIIGSDRTKTSTGKIHDMMKVGNF